MLMSKQKKEVMFSCAKLHNLNFQKTKSFQRLKTKPCIDPLNDNYKMWFAHFGDNIVGWCSIDLENIQCCIVEVYVIEKHRRKGIASFLASRALKYLDRSNIKPSVYMNTDISRMFWESVALNKEENGSW